MIFRFASGFSGGGGVAQGGVRELSWPGWRTHSVGATRLGLERWGVPVSGLGSV